MTEKMCGRFQNANLHFKKSTTHHHRFDLTDLPPYLVDALRESKVCLADLEEKLMREEVIYGARTAGGSETATASEESKW